MIAKATSSFFLGLIASSLLGSVQAESLYASHYSGSIYLLSLNSTSNGGYTLSNTASIVGCGVMPSWLTYDSTNKMLYCSDESYYGSGSISSFSVGSDGRLTQTAKASAILGAVANVLYGGSDGKGYIAIAH
jgi:6-phosphogluconolactonase (cycloisomerase 2 family)